MPGSLAAIASVSLQDALDVTAKAVGLIGGAGGLVYWVSLWRSRIRVVAVIQSDNVDTKGADSAVFLNVEFENRGRQVTSLQPVVIVEASPYDPTNASERLIKRVTYRLKVGTADRALHPFTARQVQITGTVENTYLLARFRVYKFRLTAGRNAVARRFSLGSKDVGRWTYWRWRVWHLVTSGHPPKNISLAPPTIAR